METFAAGIVPYITIENKKYFLVGLEKSNNYWSGFVGKSEKNETIQETALREFNEETACIFQEDLEDIKKLLLNSTPVMDISGTGKNVYIYFLEFPVESQEKIKYFINSKASIEDPCYHEKSILRWFSWDEIIKPNRVFAPLRKLILFRFC
jgi:8-oxo-dGTP pyrophosphatase MutT (NUDIX family)